LNVLCTEMTLDGGHKEFFGVLLVNSGTNCRRKAHTKTARHVVHNGKCAHAKCSYSYERHECDWCDVCNEGVCFARCVAWRDWCVERGKFLGSEGLPWLIRPLCGRGACARCRLVRLHSYEQYSMFGAAYGA